MRSAARQFPLAALAILALAVAADAAASAGAAARTRTPALSGPPCAPASLNASALLDGAVTVSPLPGSRDASALTQISFLGVPLSELGAVVVEGSRSGRHAGTLEAYSQGDGGSFVPARAFLAGETVTVSAELTLPGKAAEPLRFQFAIGLEDSLTTTPARLHRLAPAQQQTFVSRPDLRPPLLRVRAHSPTAAPGDVFLAPYGVPAQAGPMIIDPSGRLVWFEPLPARMAATNLRVQQLDGAPVLTWWQGTISVHGFGIGTDVIADDHYRTLAEVRAGNGYHADLHEFQITPQRTALLTAYHAVHCDLAPIGGLADGAVTDSLLQEIDIRTGLVMFEWTSLDHIALSASYSPLAGSSIAAPYDFFHLNSINLDPDGTLLVSSRNTWAADDIDPRTGQVLWTLGGKDSNFTEAAGAATAFQHDARAIGPGLFSFFDNGASPEAHAQSRGVVLAIDSQTHAVSVRDQYLHPGHGLIADSQGSMQLLPNGDWFVGWGQEPDLSEFSATGSLLFDASLPRGYESYRALRAPWSATPLHPPALAVAGAKAYVSWNGATGVARWELLEGRSAGRLTPIGVVASAGFETALALPTRRGRVLVAAEALDAEGTVLGSSPVLTVAAGASTR